MTSDNATPPSSTDPTPPPPTPAEPFVLLSPDAPESMKDRWLWVGVLVLLAATAFIPVIRGAFIWQDDKSVTSNVLVTAPDGLSQIWTGHLSKLFGSDSTTSPGAIPGIDPAAQTAEPLPVTPHFQPLGYSLLWLEYRGWGADPFGYHAVQVALHALAVILLWLVLRNLQVPGAWLAAAVCAVHPLNAEAVGWVTQTPLVLAVTLAVASILFFLESADVTNGELRSGFAKPIFADSATAHTIALVLFAAAVLAQPLIAPVALVVPLLLWSAGKRLDGKEWGRIVPMIAIGAVALVIYVLVELRSSNNSNLDIAPAFGPATFGLSIWFYLFKILFPFGLSFDYGVQNAGVIGWVGLVAAVIGLAIIFVKAKSGSRVAKGLLIAVCSYLLLLVATGGPVPTSERGYGLLADRFAYPATFAIVVGLVALIANYVGSVASAGAKMSSRIKSVFATAAVVLVALTVLTWSRANVLSDPAGLWRDTIARNPQSYLAHYELGSQLVEEGTVLTQQAAQLYADNARDDAAEFKKEADSVLTDAAAMFEIARTLRPNFTKASVALGLVKYRQGAYDDAETIFRRALSISPDDARANYNLGLVLLRKYRSSPQLISIAQRLQFDRSFPGLTDWVHRRLGDQRYLIDGAMQHFDLAVKSEPTLGEAMLQQALIYRQLADDAPAAALLQNAVLVKPRFVDAHRELAQLFRKYVQYRESLFHWTQVYRLSPPTPQLQVEMGTAVAQVGDFRLARQWFQQALALQPDNVEAKRGLALVEQMLPKTTGPSSAPATTPAAPVQNP